jgi:hypothetical protein
MVTFTLPAELRSLFWGSGAKDAYDLFFYASSRALADMLASPKWLGAQKSGFTGILHTWNQRLGFHPHIHYLVPVPALSKAFREDFRAALGGQLSPKVDPALWAKDWGVHIQPFGNGANAIKYLGAYVCRSAIGNSRIKGIRGQWVSFSFKDRAHGNRTRTETITGAQFLKRYFRHVLPRGLRSIRYFGFCHPAAKATRLRLAFHNGRPFFIGPVSTGQQTPPWIIRCPGCQSPMKPIASVHRTQTRERGPPS